MKRNILKQTISLSSPSLRKGLGVGFFSFKLSALILLAGLTACSDYADYNSDYNDVNPGGNLSLWENISQNSQLSNFATILESVNWDKNLNASRFYTVWAPIDGSYDAAEILLKDSADIVHEFVQNHIAASNFPVSGDVDQQVITLNEKTYTLTNNGFASVSYNQPNLPAKNGVIHIMNKNIPFLFNGYEYLSKIQDCSKFVAYCKKYEESYLDEKASVKGPIIEGIQTWLDSVIVVENTLFRNYLRAYIDREDSSYTTMAPTDKAWNDAYALIKKNYNYLASYKWQDLSKAGTTAASSISVTAGSVDDKMDAKYFTDSIVSRRLVANLTYNNNDVYNSFMKPEVGSLIGDTIFTTRGSKLTNVPEILSHVVGKKVQMSNGWSNKMDSLAFLPWETYNPEIRTTNVGRMLAVKNNQVSRIRIDRSELDSSMVILDDPEEEELTFIKAEPSTLSGKPELDIYLNDVRSATYNMYVVMVPACVEDSTAKRLPYALRFDLSYTNASGGLQKQTWGSTSAPIMTDANKVDTISLGTFTFPICYYGREAAPNLKISHTVTSFTSSNRNKYEQILRVAAIILKPVEQEEYEKANK